METKTLKMDQETIEQKQVGLMIDLAMIASGLLIATHYIINILPL